jgi:hypothetical protein
MQTAPMQLRFGRIRAFPVTTGKPSRCAPVVHASYSTETGSGASLSVVRALLRGGILNGREPGIDAAAPFRWFRDDNGVWHEYEHHPEVSGPDLAKYDYTGRSKDSA